MKLGKTSLLVLSIGIFIVLCASLGMAYSRQSQEQSQLDQELSLVQQRLKQLSPEKLSTQQKELESRLVQTGSQIKAAKDNLRQSLESIEATDALFTAAETYQVEIIRISSSALTEKELEGVTCSVLSLTATVGGEVPNLIGFVSNLSWQFPTGVVQSVKINVPEVTEEEGEEEGEGEEGEEEELEKPSANIVLSIHTYEGD